MWMHSGNLHILIEEIAQPDMQPEVWREFCWIVTGSTGSMGMLNSKVSENFVKTLSCKGLDADITETDYIALTVQAHFEMWYSHAIYLPGCVSIATKLIKVEVT